MSRLGFSPFSGTASPAVGGRLVSLYRNGTLTAQSRTNMGGVYSTTKPLAGGTFTFYVKTPNDSGRRPADGTCRQTVAGRTRCPTGPDA
ncbi:MAG: hypothetical protein NVSMB55_19550 [Mycobacteriales bacterium]